MGRNETNNKTVVTRAGRYIDFIDQFEFFLFLEDLFLGKLGFFSPQFSQFPNLGFYVRSKVNLPASRKALGGVEK